MAGKRERRKRRRVGGGILLALCLTLGLTVMIPLTPTLDAPLASVAAAAVQTHAEPDPEPEALPDAREDVVAVPPDLPAEENTPDIVEPVEPETEASPIQETDFSDAAFVGDSRTEGFHLYSGLKEGSYFYAVGATVQTVMEKATQDGPNGKETILDALSGGTYGKIYMMLGINELGWYRTEAFTDQYSKVIHRIRADHPEAKLVIQSLPPVSAEQDKKHSYVNNTRIVLFNQLLKELADEEDCIFLDTASAVTDENGFLPQNLTTDGVHLNSAGCKKWLAYLCANPV